MKITIKNTDKIVELDLGGGHSCPARVWEGTTESGVPVLAFIARISPLTHDEAINQQFARELIEQPAPTIKSIPLRSIL